MPGITLDQLKAHLNVTFDDDDALLTDKLATAKTYVSGFLEPDVDVEADTSPANVNEAILRVAGWLYENREVSSGPMPSDFLDLLGKYRAWSF
jgi:uncharacterized phage protein (predicted DNA packaging)